MKKAHILTLFSLIIFCTGLYAHDDLIYRTQAGWNFDVGNHSVISKTWLSSFSGGALAGDYNGDHKLDICEIDNSGEIIRWIWKINDGNGNYQEMAPVSFGVSATDKCVVGDFNGDGKADLAVMRSGSTALATWYVDFAPCDGQFDAKGRFGLAGDIPLAGDFNADGVDDVCVYRPSTGSWYVAFSSVMGYPDFEGHLAINGVAFGLESDIPVVGDFDGDGYDDMALYRTSANQILVNLYKRNKPKYEHYALLNGAGNIDMEIPVPLQGILTVSMGDVDVSRPLVLPLATVQETGSEVNLRHGWTCIFDNSLDVDKWARALQTVGINTLEYHPWMRAHEEIAPQTSTWNTYVGDDRLWTSKDMMKRKIEKFRSIGGRSVCYTGIYAATPAFALAHPDWAMRNSGDGSFMTYGNSYLYLMSTNENVNAPDEVNGVMYKSFNEHFIAQAITAQNEYNWDGYRWDWYGLPETYVCNGLPGTGNFSYEMAPFVDQLDKAVKGCRDDVTTTALQLPSTSGNVPHYMTGAVANHQFMELWPFGTGTKYSDLYKDIYDAKSRFPDKPVFANFYPPAEMNLTASWPRENIDYQFAVCLSAGGYPAAQIVDGVAGFTDPVPFHAVNYPKDVLSRIADWNRFVAAYGAYLYYSNPAYLITDYVQGNLSCNGSNNGLSCKLKKRYDKRTRNIDAMMVDIVNFGNSADLRWDVVNKDPQTSSVSCAFDLPVGLVPYKLYCVTLDGRSELSYTVNNNRIEATVPSVKSFATLVLTSSAAPVLPDAPQQGSYDFPDMVFEYDAKGETLTPENAVSISVIDDEEPLVVASNYNGNVAEWYPVDDAFKGKKAIRVTAGDIRFNTTTKGAIRVPVNKFNRFKIAVRSNNTTASWFGFRLLKPSKTSPVWESRDLYYRVGYNQPDIAYITLVPVKPQNGVWVEYQRDIREDIKGLWGEDWADAIVTAVHYGPVDRNSADYDNLLFMSPEFESIGDLKKNDSSIFILDESGRLQVKSPELLSGQEYSLHVTDMPGRVVAQKNAVAEEQALSCSIGRQERGIYLICVNDKRTHATILKNRCIVN